MKAATEDHSGRYDAIVIGAGPSGVFFAYEALQVHPEWRIAILERGREVENRKCPEKELGKCVKCDICHITSGFSGAGAFSDGKLSLFNEEDDDFHVGGNLHKVIGVEETKRVISYTDSVYLKFGATTELEGISNPAEVDRIRKKAQRAGLELINIPIRHLGTDKSPEIFRKIENYLLERGVEIMFQVEVTDLIIDANTIKGVKYCVNGNEQAVYAPKVVLAVGRSGADWLENMCQKHNIESAPSYVDIGVRYELPDAVMETINACLYEGKFVGKPDPFNDKVRTFCQNPSGVVSVETYKNGLSLVNGHSYKESKTENTNLALLATINLAGMDSPMEYARNIARNINALANGGVLVQRLGDIQLGKRTWQEELEKNSVIPSLKSAQAGDLSLGMPHRILSDILGFIYMLDKVIPGFGNADNLLYGAEMKFYSNKLVLDQKLQTSVDGLFAIGDGCGLTRGLMMASASGVQLARLTK